MHKVTQKNTKKGEGDCFPACIASFLEQPLKKFPTENCKEWNSFHWGRWLSGRGITLFGPPRHQSIYYQGDWFAVVPSIVNEGGWHAVVMHDDKLAWDPSNKKKRESIELQQVQIGWLLVLSDMWLFKHSELCPAE